MADVRDVAQFIVELSGRRIETMKLQKLLYFAQGWHLAWEGHPLFKSPIKAWKYGPVVTEIYPQHKGKASYDLDVDGSLGDSSNLTIIEQINIEDTFNFYDAFNGFELAEMSHQHSPWIDAYVHAPNSRRGRQTIPLSEIKSTFEELAESEQEAPNS